MSVPEPAPASRANRRRAVLWLLARLLVVALVAWGVHRTVMSGWDELQRQGWSAAQLHWGWLSAAAGLYLLGMLPAARFWQQILLAMGQRPGLREAVRAFYLSQLGKYVPGKAMVVVMRAALVDRRGTSPAFAAAAVFYETLTFMSVGSVLAAVVLAVLMLRGAIAPQPWHVVLSLGMACVTGAPLARPVLRIVTSVLGKTKFDPAMIDALGRIGWHVLWRGWFNLAAGWALMGVSLWATAVACGYDSPLGAGDELLICTAASALASVVGFLSMIPGGALVREAVLLALLRQTYGEAGALVVPLVLRLEWLLAEAILAGILYPMGRAATTDAAPAAPQTTPPRESAA